MADIARTLYKYDALTGIQAQLKIPSNFDVGSGSFLAFYLGFDANSDSKMECGISYADKGDGSGKKWRKFMNNRGSASFSTILTNQPVAGDIMHLKLVNNMDGTASFYLNGYLVGTLSSAVGLPDFCAVKMCHTAQGSSGDKWYKAKFYNIEVRTYDYLWVPWNSDYTTYKEGDMTVISWIPLETTNN